MPLPTCDSCASTERTGREGTDVAVVVISAQEDSVIFFMTPLPAL